MAGHQQSDDERAVLLDDEAVGRLGQQNLTHPTLIEECPNRAEDLFEILAGAAFVDPHPALPLSSRRSGGLGIRIPSSGRTGPDPSRDDRSGGTRRSLRV